MANTFIDERGKRYDRLFVHYATLTPAGSSSAHWFCECDCGKFIVVRGTCLRRGHTKSCGCLQPESVKAENEKRRGKRHPRYRHGKHCGRSTKKQRSFNESIRKRDNYTCQDCDKTQEQELLDCGKILHVHHKNGDHFDNRDKNVVTVCGKCHVIYSQQQYRQMQAKEALDASLLACDDEAMAKLLGDIV